MTITELQERLAIGENLTTEFKQWPVHPDDLAASIVAFANTNGGQLILGVSDDRKLVGLQDTDAVARTVDNVAFNNCEPPITVVQETVASTTQPEIKVLVVNIPKGDQRPYRTNRGVYYIRTTSGRRQASREELLRLFQSSESLYYDETPLTRLSVTDLNLDSFEKYLAESGLAHLVPDTANLLRNWRLVLRDHPTVCGVLLFGDNPQKHLPYAQINAFRFPGTDSSVEPSDAKEIKGKLLDLISQTEQFLKLHLRNPHVIKGFEPEQKPELPEEALREAVVNAVAHRDYTVNGPIRLFVLDDRVEIHTPGKPPNTVDVEAMKVGVHVPRNPYIYARLADAGLVTRAGSGVRRMIRLVREATGKEVGIQIREFELLLTIPRAPGAK